ncbi:MAG: metallophosphoesterase [Candidatus Aenigmatarchaeota archaeon]
MEPKFITNYPSVLVKDKLVIADLHIGIEFEFYESGIKIPSNIDKIEKAIEKLIKMTRAKTILILGDVKHKVPGITKQELREIPEFFSMLAEKVTIEIVPGNHDGALKKYLPENEKIKLYPSKGFLFGKFYFLHGHTWPSKEFLKAKYVFIGHEHPQIEFRDALGYRFTEQVWIRAKLSEEKIIKKYKEIPNKLPELIIVPHFNRLCGGISMNSPLDEIEKRHKVYHTGIGPLVRCANLEKAKIYLLDGTFLGELKNLL